MVAANNPLEQFRSKTKRLAIHPLEIALLWIVALHLVFLPWAIGGMRPWSQIISLVLAVISFIVALLPRNYTAEHTGGASFRLLPVPKLLKFPIFWLGLAMLALVTTQALNPAWEYHNDGKNWWMQRIPYITWLPHSVRVPFSHWGPWRQLIIYSSAFLTVCAIWVGFTRRRTLQRFFLILAANGVALAAFGLAERITGTTKIYWIRESENRWFYASFVYKNHAAAYMLITMAVTCGFAYWHFFRGIRRFEKSNPSGVFAFLASFHAICIIISLARGATLVMVAYLVVMMIVFFLYQNQVPRQHRSSLITLMLILALGVFLASGSQALHIDVAWKRIQHVFSGEDLSVEARQIIARASFDMLRDHWCIGSGSGSFEFLFPIYQQHYPKIMGLLWRHAHNDVLELPIELGIPGVLLILTSFSYWIFSLARKCAWQNSLTTPVILGLLFLVGMSWGDFVFQNPAILITWSALWPACAAWTRIDEQRGRV